MFNYGNKKLLANKSMPLEENQQLSLFRRSKPRNRNPEVYPLLNFHPLPSADQPIGSLSGPDFRSHHPKSWSIKKNEVGKGEISCYKKFKTASDGFQNHLRRDKER
jgi:hypothetical protein